MIVALIILLVLNIVMGLSWFDSDKPYAQAVIWLHLFAVGMCSFAIAARLFG